MTNTWNFGMKNSIVTKGQYTISYRNIILMAIMRKIKLLIVLNIYSVFDRQLQ